MQIDTRLGDITQGYSDAIVNAANTHLRGGSGVDGAIHAAAGPDLARACKLIGSCKPGHAVATGAFNLSATTDLIIHTVGPFWKGGKHNEDRVLASCYRRSLRVADIFGAKSVAFPAISTGVYGYPPERAAQVAVRALSTAVTLVSHVLLVAFDYQSLDILMGAIIDGDPSVP